MALPEMHSFVFRLRSQPKKKKIFVGNLIETWDAKIRDWCHWNLEWECTSIFELKSQPDSVLETPSDQ